MRNLNRIGIGCSKMTLKNKNEGISIIRNAVEKGIPMIDTADFYGSGESEMVVGEATDGVDRECFYIADKFGALMSPDGRMYGLDVHPDRVKNYIAYSLKRLKTDYIDLYMPARIDLAIPVEETVGAVAEIIEKGYVREIGLSQVDAETLRKAEKVHHISYVELNYSIMNRSYENVISAAHELGIKVIAFGVIAHGVLSGFWSKEKFIMSTLGLPENIDSNLILVDKLKNFADMKGMNLPQLAAAWVMAKGDDIIPVLGMSKRKHFEEFKDIEKIRLTADEVEKIERLVPQNEIKGKAFPDMKFRNGKVVKDFFEKGE